MEELKELFLKIGYNKEEYIEIINSYALKYMKQETLIKKVQENYDFLVSLGYSDNVKSFMKKMKKVH